MEGMNLVLFYIGFPLNIKRISTTFRFMQTSIILKFVIKAIYWEGFTYVSLFMLIVIGMELKEQIKKRGKIIFAKKIGLIY